MLGQVAVTPGRTPGTSASPSGPQATPPPLTRARSSPTGHSCRRLSTRRAPSRTTRCWARPQRRVPALEVRAAARRAVRPRDLDLRVRPSRHHRGPVDKRVLAVLAFLSRSGLRPTVSALRCGQSRSARAAPRRRLQRRRDADHSDQRHAGGRPPGHPSITDLTIRTLMTLPAEFLPARIVSLMRYPGAQHARLLGLLEPHRARLPRRLRRDRHLRRHRRLARGEARTAAQRPCSPPARSAPTSGAAHRADRGAAHPDRRAQALLGRDPGPLRALGSPTAFREGAAMSAGMARFGGIDLGGTKIQAVVVDEVSTVLGSARRPTPTKGGPEDVAAAMEQALRDAAKAAELEPAELAGVGVGLARRVSGGTVSGARNLPGWKGSFPLAATLERCSGPGGARQRRAGRHRRRVPARRGPALQLAARRLLGNRRGRRAHPRRRGVDGTRRRRRDRPHGRRAERRALHVRQAGLHGGLRRARRDGRARASRRRGARQTSSS